MASTSLAACAFLLVAATRTQAFMLPQPALPSTSSKPGLLQQQQQVSLILELEKTESSRRS